MTNPGSGPHLIDWLGLVVDAAVPLLIFLLGFWFKKYVDDIEQRRKSLEVESAWRLEIFREFLPCVNTMYCYFMYQGEWRDMTPADITEEKRRCDRIVYMNRFLWSEEFLCSYRHMIVKTFAENQGQERDFLIRANVNRHRSNPKWRPEWEKRFVAGDEYLSRDEFLYAYDEMLSFAVRDLGIKS